MYSFINLEICVLEINYTYLVLGSILVLVIEKLWKD